MVPNYHTSPRAAWIPQARTIYIQFDWLKQWFMPLNHSRKTSRRKHMNKIQVFCPWNEAKDFNRMPQCIKSLKSQRARAEGTNMLSKSRWLRIFQRSQQPNEGTNLATSWLNPCWEQLQKETNKAFKLEKSGQTWRREPIDHQSWRATGQSTKQCWMESSLSQLGHLDASWKPNLRRISGNGNKPLYNRQRKKEIFVVEEVPVEPPKPRFSSQLVGKGMGGTRSEG